MFILVYFVWLLGLLKKVISISFFILLILISIFFSLAYFDIVRSLFLIYFLLGSTLFYSGFSRKVALFGCLIFHKKLFVYRNMIWLEFIFCYGLLCLAAQFFKKDCQYISTWFGYCLLFSLLCSNNVITL